jgi:hypothetical protein
VIPVHLIDIAAERVTTDKVHQEGDCLISERTPSHTYARVSVGGLSNQEYAHRVVWIAAHGPIPGDLTIDHVCRNTKCVNVDHLRLLPNVENAASNGNAIKTTCVNGHPLADAYISKLSSRRPRRECRPCKLASVAAYEARKRAP